MLPSLTGPASGYKNLDISSTRTVKKLRYDLKNASSATQMFASFKSHR